ncbi:MAG TPA: serine/threonine-protein kinase [Stellaceae bacterium]|nr:serine/threonine-protein kinase [Stellaceae bacterium]
MAEGRPGGETLPRPLGRYSLIGVLGRGAMGVVYRAHDPMLDRAVAIKLVRADLLEPAERQEFLDRFRLEARAAARCSHPNIVSVFDFSDDAAAPSIVMELVEGETLQQRLRAAPPLPPAEAIAIARQMLDALGYAHAQGIVHRDVKPANVIALRNGRIKLMDFGVARVGGVNLTQAGMMVGTLRYMAPEQAAGREMDHRADLFAAAVVVYEMLTDATPFPGSTAGELLTRLVGPEPADLAALRGGLAGFAPIFRRALAKAPAERYPTAAALAEALGQVPVVDAGDATVVAARPVPAALTGTLLDSIEKTLATYVGPISRVLVQKAASGTADADEFYTRIANEIPREEDRRRFLAAAGRSSAGAPAATVVTTPPAAAGLPAEAVAAAQAILASFIGPIAKVVAREAAKDAGTLDALRDKMLLQLQRPDEQARFRQRFKAEIEGKFQEVR